MRDELCRGLIAENPAMMVPWYLMAAYAYYHLDSPILSDGLYDELCRRLDAELPDLDHFHKHLVPTPAASGGHGIDFPSRVRGAAERLLAGN